MLTHGLSDQGANGLPRLSPPYKGQLSLVWGWGGPPYIEPQAVRPPCNASLGNSAVLLAILTSLRNPFFRSLLRVLARGNDTRLEACLVESLDCVFRNVLLFYSTLVEDVAYKSFGYGFQRNRGRIVDAQ